MNLLHPALQPKLYGRSSHKSYLLVYQEHTTEVPMEIFFSDEILSISVFFIRFWWNLVLGPLLGFFGAI